MDNIHPYFKEVLGDKEYTTLLDEYSKKYKQLTDDVPAYKRLRIMKQVAELQEMKKKLVLREVEIRYLTIMANQSKKWGETNGK